MKYPIGMQSFEQIREDGYVYVDKTSLVYDLVQNGKIYFLSRPRRFGKSLLVSTLENYFLGHRELFKGLAIDSLETEWAEYPVFHLDFNGNNFTQPQSLSQTLETFVAKGEEAYGKDKLSITLGNRFASVLKYAHMKTGRRAVVLIDEYDKPLLDVMNTGIASPVVEGEVKTLEDYNREILKGFYSVFKLADRHLQFVLLTGVTKFSQISVFSGFNQPKDISYDARYDALCGITKEELLTVFREQIKDLGIRNRMSEEETVAALTRKYDGYHFSEGMVDVFNPFSLLNCFSSLKFADYWFASGTPTYLMRLMTDSDVNVNELAGKEYDASEFVDYKATKQRPLPMLYQSGYFTIKGYNQRRNTYLLDFPNEEVRSGMVSMLASDYFGSNEATSSWINSVSDTLEAGDIERFRLQLTALLANISYRFQRKDDARECERHFQYTFYLVLRMISCFTVFIEKQQSEGRVDCVVETPNYIYIFEFKRDGSAEEALKQIEDMGYAREYAADGRKIYQIGCNFSSKTGTIDGWKMK